MTDASDHSSQRRRQDEGRREGGEGGKEGGKRKEREGGKQCITCTFYNTYIINYILQNGM